jgi:nucleoside-diphosphate-sugar epimerase/glyoxylase-like metal-dependent hydrolase (beta-lactamase superfamily II)
MVTEDSLSRIALLLADDKLRVLVTGATGFVGRYVSSALAAAGQDVLATGRNPYLAPPGVPFETADLRDRDRVIELCEDRDVVIHCAAQSSPWQEAARLRDVNVGGTQNVIDASLHRGVSRLVHISSTAVHFKFTDQLDIREHGALPKRPACGYAATKLEAERCVQAAVQEGLDAVILRIRAVFGPGDNGLLPRLLRTSDAGRLRQIGDGENVSELTYIDNVVYAIALAMRRGSAGGVYTITNGEPIELWPLLREVLRGTGRNDNLPQRPYWAASLAASLTERLHRVAGLRGEPAVSRYVVGLLGKSQTFSLANAVEQLGYEPIVSLQDGVAFTLQALTKRVDAHAPNQVDVSLRTTGYTSGRLSQAEHGAPRQPTRFHAMIGIVRHAQHGVTLFDTGYATRYYEAAARWPLRMYDRLLPVVTDDAHSALAVVQREGIDPADVRRIIVSHFHIDHICGLHDFPQADIIATRDAWDAVRGRRGFSAMRRGFDPSLVPDGIQNRLYLLDNFHEPGIGPFERTHCLFGDGSVRLVELPGHAAGQIGLLLQTGVSERKLLVADAAWTRSTVKRGLPITPAFRLIADDTAAAKATLHKLTRFHKQYPDVEIVPTHCPDVARQYGFDSVWRAG